MNLLAESLITGSLNKKGKHTLKKFDCNNCGQTYVYIVEAGVNEIKCNICDTVVVTKGEI